MNMTQDLEKVIKTLYNKEGICMNDKKVALLLGFMCFLLVIAICVQINTVNNSYAGVAKTKTENELRDSVLKLKEKYDSAYALVEKNEKEMVWIFVSDFCFSFKNFNIYFSVKQCNNFVMCYKRIKLNCVIFTPDAKSIPKHAWRCAEFPVG